MISISFRSPLSNLAFVRQHDVAMRCIQALLLYLPTLFWLNNRYLLGFIVFSLAFYPWRIERKDWPFFAFAAYVFLNTLLGIATGSLSGVGIWTSGGLLGGIVLVLAYLAARTMSELTLRCLLGLICAEACIEFLQAHLGIRVFFFDQVKDAVDVPYPEWPDLATFLYTPMECVVRIYHLQPKALNPSSLLMAVKLVLGLIIVSAVPFRQWVRMSLYAFLSAALVVTYCRAAMAGMAVFTLIWIAYELYQRRLKPKQWGFWVFTLLAAVLALRIIFPLCDNVTLKESLQVVRYPDEVHPVLSELLDTDTPEELESGKVDPVLEKVPEKQYRPEDLSFLDKVIMIAHRADLWEVAARGIKKHPWVGEHSVRHVVLHKLYTNNAYLGMLYVHGILGALLLGLFYWRRIFEHWNRLVLLLPLLTFNVTDDTLFWYMSMQDMIAIYILTVYTGPLFPTPVIPRRRGKGS